MPPNASLRAYRGRHPGADILVCGCGTSLRSLEGPERYLTIGVNDVGRRFQPDYLVVVNPPHQFTADRFEHVHASRARALFSQLALPVPHPNLVRFRLGTFGGTDLSDPDTLHYTQNSPYVAVCLAAVMGARRIGLIGVDFTEGHFFGETGRHPLTGRLASIDRQYGELARALAEGGVQLLNLSESSRLTSLPRRSVSEMRGRSDSPVPLAARPELAARAPGRVLHMSRTNCAGAIWNLHGLLRGHAGVDSRVVTASDVTSGRRYPRDLLLSERERVRDAIRNADVVHFHNWWDAESPELAPFRDLLRRRPSVLQFHSEPDVVRPFFPGRDPATRTDLRTLVVAQKQARLYPRARPVPNAIDIHAPTLRPALSPQGGRVKVVYTPTDRRDYPADAQGCRGKGYDATRRILENLVSEGLIEAVVRTGVPWAELMEIRRASSVCIDECVTGGYHLTSLEALAQGLVAVAYLDEQTQSLVAEVTGSEVTGLPFLNTPIHQLEDALRLLARNPAAAAALGKAGWTWMERFWAPERVVEPYLVSYQEARAPARTPPRVEGRTPLRAPGVEAPATAARGRGPAAPPVPGALAPARPNPRPRRSEEFPQTVRLAKGFLALRGGSAGTPCHILGNGPSVTDLDLSLLAPRLVFAVNASSLLFGALGRPADVYCVSDRRFLIREDSCELARLAAGPDTRRVFAGYCAGFLPDDDIQYVRIVGGDGISDDLEAGLFHGCSVALFAAQVALWLGSTEIFLHGCEMDYRGGRFYSEGAPRPHDPGIYPRVEASVRRLARWLRLRGGQLTVVGPSRLVGDFGGKSVEGVAALDTAALERQLRAGAGTGVPVRTAAAPA